MWNERVEGSVEDVWAEFGKRSGGCGAGGRGGWGQEGGGGGGARGEGREGRGGKRRGHLYLSTHSH